MRTEWNKAHTAPTPRASQAGHLRSLTWLLIVCGILCVSSGCATGFREYFANGFKVGPNYCPPSAPVSERWIDFEDSRVHMEPPIELAWWRVFRDPTLDELVQTASRQNITLREAGFRIEQSRALRAIAVGNLFPQQQTVQGAYTRRMNSFGTNITAGGAGGLPGAQRFFSVYNTGATLAWELDFWGRFRRAVESADAQLDASIENYDDVLVLLIGEVATSYVEYRSVEQRIEYARQNVISQRGSLDLAEKKREGGAGSRLDVTQAITNVAQTESQIPSLEIQLRQAQNNLCVLMGIPPQDLQPLLSRRKGIPTAPPEVAVGIPSDLIRRRPDVRRAEREIAAQSAQIGIAETDLYPTFTLTGNLFTQANTFQDLFRTSSVGGSFGPSFSWNVLNYGRIRNNVVAQEALFMQEVAQYQQVVLNANREVEDGIISFLRSQEQARFLREGVDAAQESRDLVNELYQGGKADFNRVFVAELSLQQQQDTLAQAEGLIAQSLVTVYRALGGGWQIRLEDLPPMTDVRPEEVERPAGPMIRDPMLERLPPAPME